MGIPDSDAPISFKAAIPSNWFTPPDRGVVWITVYRTHCIDQNQLPQGFKAIDLGDSSITLIDGKLELPNDVFGIDSVESGAVKISWRQREVLTSDGVHLVIAIPYATAGQPDGEILIKQKVSVITGMLLSANGRNFVYERIFEGSWNLATKELQYASNTIENPLVFPVPDASDQRLSLIKTLNNSIQGMDATLRHRVELSLRWFDSANRSSGVDSFLQYWIALETLAMPDSTNIAPIQDWLAQSYGITKPEAATRFFVGRLYNIRGQIVHAGRRQSVDADILAYIDAIYTDVLFAIVGVASVRSADAILSTGRITVANLR